MAQTVEDIAENIDVLREELIQIASIHGLNNPKTLNHSEKLDKLIIKYQKLHLPSLTKNINN
ncbi:Spo0E family sporulation regulatory protein-aspartic acid phosphatase [Metabacillus sp. SLBN-84]